MELVSTATIPRMDQRYTRKFVECTCQASDSIGHFVTIAGPATGSQWMVTRVNPGDSARMPAVGVIVLKPSPTSAVVQRYGEVTGILTGLNIGKLYCVDYTGVRIGPPAIGVNGYSLRQFIGFAVASDILALEIDTSIIKHR